MALDLEQSLKHALARCEGDTERAAALFLAWCQQNSEVADLLQPIVKDAIESRLSKFSEAETKSAG